MNRRLTVPATTAALLLLTLGCGQWQQYDGAPPPAGGSATIDTLGKVTRMDHLALSGLLSRFLMRSTDGKLVLVDYDAIDASEEARYLLAQALAMTATIDSSDLANEKERLAYWINGYNAAVIKGVLLRYKGDHTFKVINVPFFDGLTFTFGGVALTLNQLEHGVARGKLDHKAFASASKTVKDAVARWHKELWKDGKVDSRIHAAFNCAARSCPNLMDAAPAVFHAGSLDKQLQAATVNWVDDTAKGAGPDGISRLFEWYAEDFVASHGSVDAFIKAHRTGGLTGVKTGAYLTYDWTLNISPKKKK